jgi:hypothetical protein
MHVHVLYANMLCVNVLNISFIHNMYVHIVYEKHVGRKYAYTVACHVRTHENICGEREREAELERGRERGREGDTLALVLGRLFCLCERPYTNP